MVAERHDPYAIGFQVKMRFQILAGGDGSLLGDEVLLAGRAVG